ncbi:ras-related protein Rab-22A-like [Parasteatoda tepidariorum]|uniref:ras-related protein Rab-22A-like n=1 Tax=Parasteatoda tepidariorum TaxID=114398 RepID=UPI00077FD04C|nr:ras-related protein Rab-22A-like [Parasteatoda tepidariorum]
MLAKVCLVGPKGVGKSTMASKFDKNAFSKIVKGTAIANFNMVIGNYKVDLQIWDTCGEDRFRCMGPIFYKATRAAMCVFDITSRESFYDLQAWVISVQQNANDECIFVLVGNKRDLIGNREISEKEAKKYAESIGGTYFEICASTGEGVNEMFEHVASSIVRQNDCYNSYHAKLAITSSGMGFCGCTMRKKQKSKPDKKNMCFPCLVLR